MIISINTTAPAPSSRGVPDCTHQKAHCRSSPSGGKLCTCPLEDKTPLWMELDPSTALCGHSSSQHPNQLPRFLLTPPILNFGWVTHGRHYTVCFGSRHSSTPRLLPPLTERRPPGICYKSRSNDIKYIYYFFYCCDTTAVKHTEMGAIPHMCHGNHLLLQRNENQSNAGRGGTASMAHEIYRWGFNNCMIILQIMKDLRLSTVSQQPSNSQLRVTQRGVSWNSSLPG